MLTVAIAEDGNAAADLEAWLRAHCDKNRTPCAAERFFDASSFELKMRRAVQAVRMKQGREGCTPSK